MKNLLAILVMTCVACGGRSEEVSRVYVPVDAGSETSVSVCPEGSEQCYVPWEETQE